MTDKQITRRKFMCDSLVGAAGIAVGLSAAERTAAVQICSAFLRCFE
jgi:hypothetical protein